MSDSPGRSLLRVVVSHRLVLCQCCVLLALSTAMCVVYWLPGTLPAVESVQWSDKALGDGDFGRFVCQGWWLAQGYGFREVHPDGNYCTGMAPGYPVFLAAMFTVSKNFSAIRMVQCGLHLSSMLLLFLACRRHGSVFAFLLAVAVGTSPWLAAQSSMVMSEVLGVFWASLLVAVLVSVFDGRLSGRWNLFCCLLAGFCCSALCLTSPVLTPFCFLMTCVLAIMLLRTRRNWNLVFLLLGASAPMGLWQGHCIYANGRPCLTLLTPLEHVCATDWVSAWAETEGECAAAFHAVTWATEPPDLSKLPPHAFRSDSEFKELSGLAAEAANERAGAGNGVHVQALSRRCTEIARDRRRDNPLRCSLVLPVKRIASAVVTKKSVNFLAIESSDSVARLWPPALLSELRLFGARRATFRFCRGLIAAWAWCIHLLVCGYYIVFLASMMITRDWVIRFFCVAVISSLFAFGYLSPESRRLVPFLPLVAATVVLHRVRGSARKPTARGDSAVVG